MNTKEIIHEYEYNYKLSNFKLKSVICHLEN